MNSYTLPQLYHDGYSNGDIDTLVSVGLATFSSKNGSTALTIPDKVTADNFVYDTREREQRGR